jgi:hypothetical protein
MIIGKEQLKKWFFNDFEEAEETFAHDDGVFSEAEEHRLEELEDEQP